MPSLGDLGLCGVLFDGAPTDIDLALIVTAHPSVDHELVAQRARIVVDLRGVTRSTSAANVVQL